MIDKNDELRLCKYCGMERHISEFSYKTNVKNVKGGKCRQCSREYAKQYRKEHPKSSALSRTRLYGVWRDMIRRCQNPLAFNYADYGGRGIRVCKEWNNYSVFETWANNNGYDESLSIDRIDNEGDYTPKNCRWATPKEQSRNRRNTQHLTFYGITRPLAEWAEITGVNRPALYQRLYKHGWDIGRALTVPVRECAHGDARRSEKEGPNG